MSWNCSRCREEIEDYLEVCWSCGTGRDGTVDPEFQSADEYQPPLPDECSEFSLPRFSLGSLFNIVTVFCLVLGLVGALSWLSEEIPFILSFIIILIAGGYLGLLSATWIFTRRMQKRQRKHRDNENFPDRP